MKAKTKKRLSILVIVLLLCIIPLGFLQNARVPLASELEDTDVGGPPGEATQTDADLDISQVEDLANTVTIYKRPADQISSNFLNFTGGYSGSTPFIVTDSDGKMTDGYCMQAHVAAPPVGEANAITYHEGCRLASDPDKAASIAIAMFAFGGSHADPNVNYWGATHNVEDGGTYGTYLVSNGSDVKAVRGLMIRGVVYEMTVEQARSLTQTIIHGTATSYDAAITSVTAKDGNPAVGAAYEKLKRIARTASDVCMNNGNNYKEQGLVDSFNGISEGGNTAYSHKMTLTKQIYNNKTKAWVAYSDTDKLSSDFADADGNVKIKISYSSFGVCNNLTTSDAGSKYSDDAHKTVVYNYAPFTIGNTTGHFDYFKVKENAGNQVNFTVAYDKVTSRNVNKHVPYEGDAANPAMEAVNVFEQTATVTCKYTDLQNKKLAFTCYTEEATAHTEYYNGAKYAARMYKNDSYQDALVLNAAKHVSTEFSVDLKAQGNAPVALKKTSTNPTCTNGNPLYSLAGTKYGLYTDQKCTTLAKTTAGKDAYLVCDANGDTNTLDMALGKYYLKELVAGKGYLINPKVPIATVDLTAASSTTKVVNVSDVPVDDPISVALTKSSDSNKKLQGAVYCIEYYSGIQTYDENQAKSGHSGNVSKWYFATDANGEADFKHSPTATGYTSSNFYTNDLGDRTIPLGTVVMYEEKAPVGYTKSPTHWVFQVRQESSGGEAFLYGKNASGTEVKYDNSVSVTDTNTPNFKDTPIKAQLTVQKKSSVENPKQGDKGDTSLEGAVFGLYARRDIVDAASNTVEVAAKKASGDTTIKHTNGNSVIDPTTGNEVTIKAGEDIPLAVSSVSGADGKVVFDDVHVANNADDYYVKEIVAPKDFYCDHNEHTVDLRDNRTDAQKSDLTIDLIKKSVTINDQPIEQPIHVKKYAMKKGTQNKDSLEPLNGAEFSVYLISSLKGDKSSYEIVNADGSKSYNFNSYDFSGETAEIVTEDGQRILVTGDDGDDGEVTSIDLEPGTYVVVETKAPKGYLTVDPVVVQLPRYKVTADGIVTDEKDDPKIYATYSVSPLDSPIEQYLKINKRDSHTGDLVMHNNATFSIWDITDSDTSKYSEDVKTFGTRVTQERETDTGYETVSDFVTNDEGFLMLYKAFGYGEYAIVEEKAPAGYDKAPNIIFSVREDGIYLWVDDAWEKATTATSTTANTTYTFWEVNMVDTPYSLDVAKADYETGKWVPNAELTIYKALDSEGHIAVDENGDAVILTARDESGETVQAKWNTTEGFKHFEVVPTGWYVLRETKAPTEAGYATMADKIIFVGKDEQIAPNGKVNVAGEETIYYSFTYTEDGVEIVDATSFEYDTTKGKIVLYDKPITVEISKQNAATEEELPGAELTLYRYEEDGSETEIETWTSTTEPHVIKHLTPGKYKLHENTIPLGFYAKPNTIDFEIVDSEELQKCAMVNHPIVVEFNKRSLNANDAVAGATLALYKKGDAKYKDSVATPLDAEEATPSDAAGDVAESFKDENGVEWFLTEMWVTTYEPHVITGLYPGDYKLIEVKTPHGYTTSQEVEFTITDQQAPENVYMYDEKIHLGLVIHKTGESLTSTEVVESEEGKYNKFIWKDTDLSGVVFEVYNEDEELVTTMTTDDDGYARVDDLAWGKYHVKEVVPAGMVDHHVVYTVDYAWEQGLTDENILAKLEVYNESCNTQLNLFKTGEYPELVDGKYVYKQKMLKGVLFGVYASEDIYNFKDEVIAPKDTCVGYAITDDNGVACFNQKLVRGNYYYKELKTAGPEYVMDTDTHNFTLVLNNSKVEVVNLNEIDPLVNKLAKGKIKVYKIAHGTKIPLAGAEFDLHNSDDVVVAHLVTDNAGYAETSELPYGSYYLKETKAPETYQMTNKKFDVEIVHDGETTIVTIENATVPKLGTSQIVVVGILAVIASIMVVITFKKVRKRKA